MFICLNKHIYASCIVPEQVRRLQIAFVLSWSRVSINICALSVAKPGITRPIQVMGPVGLVLDAVMFLAGVMGGSSAQSNHSEMLPSQKRQHATRHIHCTSAQAMFARQALTHIIRSMNVGSRCKTTTS